MRFFAACLASFLVTFSIPLTACSSYIVDAERIALLAPSVIGEEYAPFFYAEQLVGYTNRNPRLGRDRLRNVADWAKELQLDLPPGEIMDILYDTKLADWVMAVEQGPSEKNWQHNPVWCAVSQRPDILDYMLWIKGYEKPGMFFEGWHQKKYSDKIPSKYTTRFKERALAGYAVATANSFLKERYAYQLLLLAYYAKDGAAMTTYFDRHFASKNSVLADWARFHYANHFKEPFRFEVEMANAFRYAPEKAVAAHMRTRHFSFYYGNMEKMLGTTCNDAERSNLYAMRALKTRSHALKYIREAYRLDPTNPVMDLLVIREFNKVENWLMSAPLTGWNYKVLANYSGFSGSWQSEQQELRRQNHGKDHDYVKELRAFIDTYKSPGGPPFMEEVLRAEAALLDEDYEKAFDLSGGLLLLVGKLGKQAKIINYFAFLHSQPIEQPGAKEQLADYLLEMETYLTTKEEKGQRRINKNLINGLSRAASNLYLAKGDTLTAYFLFNRSLTRETSRSSSYPFLRFIDRHISPELMSRIIETRMANDTLTSFGRLLKTCPMPDINMLYNHAGTLALRKNKLELALGYFSRPYRYVPSRNRWPSPPALVSPINQIFPSVQHKKPFTSKVKVVRELMALEARAKIRGKDGLKANLALAKAWFNMSHHGSCWWMLKYGKYHRENQYSGELPDYATVHDIADFNVIRRAARAKQYLRRAAAMNTDVEYAAEIDLTRRSIEWEISIKNTPAYGTKKEHSKRDSLFALAYRKHIAPFANSYKKTSYFQQALSQCSWLPELLE